MNIIRSRIQQRYQRQADAVRPGVIRVRADVVVKAPRSGQQEPVVALRAAVVILGEITKLSTRNRPIQNSALIEIRCLRTEARCRQSVAPPRNCREQTCPGFNSTAFQRWAIWFPR